LFVCGIIGVQFRLYLAIYRESVRQPHFVARAVRAALVGVGESKGWAKSA
jgi:hypothetical protein